MYPYKELICHVLSDQNTFWTGLLPQELHLNATQFDDLWNLHPNEYHEIKIHSRLVKTPRWQQAYGEDYHYTGRVNKALQVPEQLASFLDWAQKQIDPRLNGLLLNWYDGRLGHYIGKHRDSIVNMQKDSSIVTLSFGEERVFRLRPWKGSGFLDFKASSGSLFVLPYSTNLNWTHEVPYAEKYQKKRISITIRAFQKKE